MRGQSDFYVIEIASYSFSESEVDFNGGGTKIIGDIVNDFLVVGPHFGAQFGKDNSFLHCIPIFGAHLHFECSNPSLDVECINRLILRIID